MANGMVGALGGLRRWFSLFMGAAALVAVGMACGGFPVLKEAPASALSLSIRLGYETTPTPDKVSLAVSFADGKQSVQISGKQRLACDGVNLIPQTTPRPVMSASVVVNRQPPGGAYMCVYTDENGKQTTFSFPEPTGHLTITSPHAGAKVPIPTLTWALSSSPPNVLTPTPTPEPPVLHNPFMITYTLPDAPANQLVSSISAEAESCSSATDETTCSMVVEAREDNPMRDGTFLVSDASPLDAGLAPGYWRVSPGPGAVRLDLHMGWMLAPQGFRSMSVDVQEHVTTTFTWVAAQ